MKPNIVAEFEMVERTSFWQKYMEHVMRRIEIIKNDTLSKRDANLAFAQGEYAGLRAALFIPNDIIRAANTPDNLVKGPGKAV